MRHDIMLRLREVMYMGTFEKSIIETFEDVQIIFIQIFRDYPNEMNFIQYFMIISMNKMNTNSIWFSYFIMSNSLISILNII